MGLRPFPILHSVDDDIEVNSNIPEKEQKENEYTMKLLDKFKERKEKKKKFWKEFTDYMTLVKQDFKSYYEGFKNLPRFYQAGIIIFMLGFAFFCHGMINSYAVTFIIGLICIGLIFLYLIIIIIILAIKLHKKKKGEKNGQGNQNITQN